MPERSRNINSEDPDKDPLAVELGRRGGRKGGRARADRMSAAERSEAARRAARARWDAAAHGAARDVEGAHGDAVDDRLRAAFIAGAEEHSRMEHGRGLTREERAGILERYPG